MTQQEFDNTGFHKGMQVNYDGGEYWVRSVNFRERLLGLLPSFLSVDDAARADDYEIDWVRCESCTILE